MVFVASGFLVVSRLCFGCVLIVSRFFPGGFSVVFVGSRWFLGGAVARLLVRQQQKVARTRNVKLCYWGCMLG